MKQRQSAHERISFYAQETPERIFRDLGSFSEGFTEEQAERFRDIYGENTVLGEKKDTILYRLRRAFVNPFSIVLLLLACISFFTDVLFVSNFSRNGSMPAIILTMLLISGIVRFIQEMRSRRITERLIKLVHTTVRVRRDGAWQEKPSTELVVGDIVFLEAGDRVPADIRLVKCKDFFVTQSVITGESGVLEKHAAPLSFSPKRMADYANTVFLGSTVMGGSCEGVVLAVGKDTVYGGITPEESHQKNGFDQGENEIAWVLIKFMALLVPIVFIASGITKGNWVESILFALSVAVGLTPELLPMVITACLAKGSFWMGQKRTIVKNINAMHGFGGMDIVCVDKTGTLTGDKVHLEYYLDILGNESLETLTCAYLNSFFHTGVSNHLDTAILKSAAMPGKEAYFADQKTKYQKLDELPFDYNRRMASVLLWGEEGKMLLTKGNVEAVVSRCSHVLFKGQRHAMEGACAESVNAIVEEMTEDGMKVLAVAGKRMTQDILAPEDEGDLTLLGYLAFFDAPKQSAAEAIQKLQNLHINVKLLTGDNADVAVSVCKRLGIASDSYLTGTQIDALDDNEFQIQIERTSIFAELSPRQKAMIVETLQGNGHTVGFLGDGMNDLPAIVQADVGISVDTATDAVKESAEVILLKKDLKVLGDGVMEGRKAFSNMSKYIKITASSNFGNICAVVIASVLLPFFPMTSIQLLLLNLLYDFLCLVLPWDNVDEELLAEPVEWSGKTLGRFMLFFGPISSIFDILTFLMLYFVLCPHLCGGAYGTLDAASQSTFIALFQTGWFLESMWTQVFILHLLRTKQIPFFQSRPSKPMVFVTVAGILAFSLLTITPLAPVVGLCAMPMDFYIFLVAIVFIYLCSVTLAKRAYILRRGELL